MGIDAGMALLLMTDRMSSFDLGHTVCTHTLFDLDDEVEEACRRFLATSV